MRQYKSEDWPPYIQTYKEWSSRAAQEGRKVGRRQKTTQYQKATHFELGSDPYK